MFSFHLVLELTYNYLEEVFRSNIILLIKGLPLTFVLKYPLAQVEEKGE